MIAKVPGRPSSSPMMAKMKSLWAAGSHCHFSRLAPSPTPHHPPSARAYWPWVVCQQEPCGSTQPPPIQSLIRPMRLALVTTMAAARAAKPAPATRNIRAGTPAEKSSPPMIARSTRPVPRSLPPSTSNTSKAPAGNTSGTRACMNLPSLRRFLVSTVAPNRTSATLANSEG